MTEDAEPGYFIVNGEYEMSGGNWAICLGPDFNSMRVQLLKGHYQIDETVFCEILVDYCTSSNLGRARFGLRRKTLDGRVIRLVDIVKLEVEFEHGIC